MRKLSPRPQDRLGAVLPFVLLSLGIVPRATAQCSPPATGAGSVSFTTLLDPLTGLIDHRGVTYIGGEIFVTGLDVMTGTRTVVAFDPLTLTTRSLSGLTSTGLDGVSPIDWYLGATDGVHLILLGLSNGAPELHYVDINGNPVLAIEAANGTQTLTQAAVSIIANLGSPSGLAFDPDANGGDGAVLAIHNFSGSFGTPPSANISCLDLDGAELPGIGSLSTTARGLALDPLRDRLWSSLDIPNFDQLDEFYETLDTSVAGLQPQVATGRSTCVESASGDSHYVEDSPFAGPDDAELLVIRPFAGPLFEDVLTAYRAPHVPESIGSGCGTPTMELTTTWPQGDGSFVTFTLANVPPPFASVALLSLNEIPGGLLLDIVGATGCNLYISPVVAQFALTPPGTASFGVGPGLNGLTLFWQGAAIAPGVNPLGVVTSNAVKWRL
ncbi:MAG: hypothetical protein KDB80_09170 [Planctomycetes bacterium]|nr:hypothetical protein [Planctomycetota bacterium]